MRGMVEIIFPGEIQTLPTIHGGPVGQGWSLPKCAIFFYHRFFSLYWELKSGLKSTHCVQISAAVTLTTYTHGIVSKHKYCQK